MKVVLFCIIYFSEAEYTNLKVKYFFLSSIDKSNEMCYLKKGIILNNINLDFQRDTNMVVQRKKDLIYNRLRDDIASGHYALGEKLLPELELAKKLDTSFITLRSALKKLEDEKLIQRIRGRGTFVVARPVLESRKRKLLLIYPEAEDKTISQNLFNRHLFSGMAEVCAGLGDSVTAENFQHPAELAARFRGGEFSGIVWDRPDVEHPIFAELMSCGVPQVTVNRRCEGIPSVCVDYIAAVDMALRSLGRFGHTKIGLCDFGFNHKVLKHRANHYIESMKKRGISNPDRWLMEMVLGNDEEREKEIRRCMLSDDPPTAVLVSHTFFYLFEKFLTEHNIKVPDDLSVVLWGEEDGFDRFSSHPYSILSDTRIEVGRRAADVIYRCLQGEDTSQEDIKIGCEFILRDGCAFPGMKDSFC